MISHLTLFTIYGFSVLTNVTICFANELDHNPTISCGVRSVEVVLRHLSYSDVSTQSIQNRFDAVCPGADLQNLSFTEIGKVFKSYGINAIALEAQSRKFQDLSTPSVLWIAPSKASLEKAGHFVTLIRDDNDQARIVDLDVLSEQEIHALEASWSGEFLAVSENHPFLASIPRNIGECCLLLLGAVIVFLTVRLTRKMR